MLNIKWKIIARFEINGNLLTNGYLIVVSNIWLKMCPSNLTWLVESSFKLSFVIYRRLIFTFLHKIVFSKKKNNCSKLHVILSPALEQ